VGGLWDYTEGVLRAEVDQLNMNAMATLRKRVCSHSCASARKAEAVIGGHTRKVHVSCAGGGRRRRYEEE
jgi:hypothetical protein